MERLGSPSALAPAPGFSSSWMSQVDGNAFGLEQHEKSGYNSMRTMQHASSSDFNQTDIVADRIEELLKPQVASISSFGSLTASQQHAALEQRRSFDDGKSRGLLDAGGFDPSSEQGTFGSRPQAALEQGQGGHSSSLRGSSSQGGFNGSDAGGLYHHGHTSSSGSLAGSLSSNEPTQQRPTQPGGGNQAGSNQASVMDPPSRTVFVRNLPPDISDQLLHDLFSSEGDVRSMYTALRHRGYVSVSYYDLRAAARAVTQLSGTQLRPGCVLQVMFAQPSRNGSGGNGAGLGPEDGGSDTGAISQGVVPMYNYDSGASREQLLWLFSNYGEVRGVSFDGPAKRKVLVEFWDSRAALHALRGMNRAELSGFRLQPDLAAAAAVGGQEALLAEAGANGSNGQGTAAGSSASWGQAFGSMALAPGGSSSGSNGAAPAGQPSGMHLSDSASSFNTQGANPQKMAAALFGGGANPMLPGGGLPMAHGYGGTTPSGASASGSGFITPEESRVGSKGDLQGVSDAAAAAMAAAAGGSSHGGSAAAAALYGASGFDGGMDAAASALAQLGLSQAADAQSAAGGWAHANSAGSSYMFDTASAAANAGLWGAAGLGFGGNGMDMGAPSQAAQAAALASLQAGLVQERVRQQQQQQLALALAGLQATPSSSAVNLAAAQQLLQAAAMNPLLQPLAALMQSNGSAGMGNGNGNAAAHNAAAHLNAAAQLLQQAGLGGLASGGALQSFNALQQAAAMQAGLAALQGGHPASAAAAAAAAAQLRGMAVLQQQQAQAALQSAAAGGHRHNGANGRPGAGMHDGGLHGASGGGPLDSERRAAQERMFSLDLDKIRAGADARTTLMIKNIPNKYTQKMLLATLDEALRGSYDFFYLPIDFKNKCNVGYAFINMRSPLAIVPLYERFANKKWERFNSEKVCSVSYARIQGRAALVSHFQNSSLMHEDKRCRPVLFNAQDDGGQSEPVPMCLPSEMQQQQQQTTTTINGAAANAAAHNGGGRSAGGSSGGGGNSRPCSSSGGGGAGSRGVSRSPSGAALAGSSAVTGDAGQ